MFNWEGSTLSLVALVHKTKTVNWYMVQPKYSQVEVWPVKRRCTEISKRIFESMSGERPL